MSGATALFSILITVFALAILMIMIAEVIKISGFDRSGENLHLGHSGGPHQFPHLQIMIRVGAHATKSFHIPLFIPPLPF